MPMLWYPTVRGVIFGALLTTPLGSALAADPFSSPEVAVSALVDAVRAEDAARVIDVLGDGSEDLVLTGVDEVDRRNWESFGEAFESSSKIVVDGDTATLQIGMEQWPFPVPLRMIESGWIFDTDAARDEILLRRIGENELTTIDVLRTSIRAQFEYFSEDRDGDGVLEFAQFILSGEDERDGLYYPVDRDEPESPLGAAIAVAAEEGYSYANPERPEEAEPYYGYYYRVLTRQGPSAPGGAFDYVINGNMVAGFAMIAFPADYGASGIMSFLVGRNGEIYERDLGTSTTSIASEIDTFDPSSEWSEVHEE